MTAVGVVGGGAFGRGLAHASATVGNRVVLWSRRPQDGLAPEIEATHDSAGLAACELIFVAVPAMHVPELAPSLCPHLDGRHFLVHVSRGLIGDSLDTVARHLASNTPSRRVGCLAGPISPSVLHGEEPGGGVVGTRFPEVVEAVKEALASPSLRLYETDDLTGTELASALVGLLGLAAGFALETRVSPAALAILMNRGLAEAARVGVTLGAHPETFHGMAGAGDLFAILAGDERAEVRLGRAMARTSDLEAAARAAGAYIEGLPIARRVERYAATVGVDAPICGVIADVLDGSRTPRAAIEELMAR